MSLLRRFVAFLIASVGFYSTAFGVEGMESVSFLNIPVGARPAALGGAYSALASDAYAMTFNPGGLGLLESPQATVMHLDYLGSVAYDFGALAFPLNGGLGVGLAIQNLRPGSIESTDLAGNPTGDFGGSFAAYSLGVAQSFGKKISLGVVGKWITSKIAGIDANGFAGDVGLMVRPSPSMGLGVAVLNVGPALTFLQESDPLPTSGRVGVFWVPVSRWLLALQGARTRTGSNSAQTGVEWRPFDSFVLRTGYKTETRQSQSSGAGVSFGLGFRWTGLEFDYAWVPLGELGNTNVFSIGLRWGGTDSSSNEARTRVQPPREENEEGFPPSNDFPSQSRGGFRRD